MKSFVQENPVRTLNARRRVWPRALLAVLLALAGFDVGCASWKSDDGTQHTLVLGFGLVSTKQAPGAAATAIRSNMIGLAAGPDGAALGYQSRQQTQIATNWSGLVEIDSKAGAPLRVESHDSQPRGKVSVTTNPKADKEKYP